jgi:glutathione S-transferase
MKLFYSKGACSLSTHIVINELNLDCEFESVDLAKKITEKGTDFYTINPRGAVPTLQTDNGDLLTENLVIQQYLTDTFDNKETLCPAIGNINRYHVLAWLSYAASDLHKSFSPFFNYKNIDQSVVDLFTATLKGKLNHLEKQLAHHDYIAGDKFTLPDAYIFVTLRWLGFVKLNLDEWINLSAYFARIKNRPAVIKAMTEEGLLVK